MNFLLKSATIIAVNSKYHQQKKDILIEKGIITKIATKISEEKGTKTISLENLHVSCGWFDTSVSFGEPGFEERETINNGLLTATKSGFTTVAVNPNTNPKVDTKAAVEFLISKTLNHIIDLHPIANLTKSAKGEEITEMYDMHQSGAIAFGDYNKTISNVNVMKIALQYAQNFNGLVLNFPLEKTLSNGYANEGINSTKLGLKGIPALAEELQITRDLSLLEYTGGKLHIPCISTAKSVKLIADAKKKGLNVTCSVTPHHLVLTDDELENFDSNYKILPPLRTIKDCKALRQGLEKGTIDMICSDHNPINIEDKKVTFENAKFGTIGLESLFGTVNSVIDLTTVIESLTTKPRKRFQLETLTIAKGEKANLTLFNPDFETVFNTDNIISTSKNTAFLGKKLKGIVYGILVGSKIALN